MRILSVSYSNYGGGAERVALDLSDQYRQLGHTCLTAVGHRRGDMAGVVEIPNDRYRSPWTRACRAIAAPLENARGKFRGTERLYNFISETIGRPMAGFKRRRGEEDFDHPGTAHIGLLMNPAPDVLHCHNLHRDYFDLRALPRLAAQFPVVVTLHDQWLLTGHCAHSFECEKWRAGCGNCPHLDTYPAIPRDATAFNWKRKRDILSSAKIHIVTPSAWLMEKVTSSPCVANGGIRKVIANGVDLSIFNPGDKVAARAKLGLPSQSHIVLFAHPGVKDSPFKDYPTFVRCAAILGARRSEIPLIFLAVGPALPAERIGTVSLQFVPRVHDRHCMADYFRAADVYMHPARAENFPLAILEAMACGKPVIASRVGGIPEQIIDGETGYLCAVGDANAMAASLQCILSDNISSARIGAAAYARAKEYFNRTTMVNGYLSLFEEVLPHRRAPIA